MHWYMRCFAELAQMAVPAASGFAGKRRSLGHDRLQQGSDELAQQAQAYRLGQAAAGRLSAQRGELARVRRRRLERRVRKRWART